MDDLSVHEAVGLRNHNDRIVSIFFGDPGTRLPQLADEVDDGSRLLELDVDYSYRYLH
ncbi:hypothetical protein LCGC14_1931450 [marine sediment metagenome]|uniref:Uncharacterized protein n=1 Tax=marine sediment metagenome TaxID=412755 RepID=A0A0F9I1T1_9ZZZZ